MGGLPCCRKNVQVHNERPWKPVTGGLLRLSRTRVLSPRSARKVAWMKNSTGDPAAKAAQPSAIVQGIVKAVILLVALIVVRVFVSRFDPLSSIVIPNTGMTAATLGVAVVDLAMILVVLNLSYNLQFQIEDRETTPTGIGLIVRQVVSLGCLVWGYLVFRAPVLPMLQGYDYIYHAAFAAGFVACVVLLGLSVNRESESITKALARWFSGPRRKRPPKKVHPPGDTGVCPGCRTRNKPDAKFCERCGKPIEEAKVAAGADLPERAERPPSAEPARPDVAATHEKPVPQPSDRLAQQDVEAVPASPETTEEAMFCSECGAKLEPDGAFCPECGAKATKD